MTLYFRVFKIAFSQAFMNENDAMKTITKEIRKAFPDFTAVFIDERDKYLAVKLRNIARGRKYFFLGSNFFPPSLVM